MFLNILTQYYSIVKRNNIKANNIRKPQITSRSISRKKRGKAFCHRQKKLAVSALPKEPDESVLTY